MHWVEDVDGVKYYYLGVIDIASTFHLVRVTDDASSEETACVFDEMWHSVFGDPTEAVEYDQGSNFKGKFEYLLEHINRRSKIAGLESAWQNGAPEVHGGVLRFIATKLVEEFSLRGRRAIRTALAEAVHAKNSLARRRGFSPLQWVLGYERALPGSVLNRPGGLASHSLALA